MKKRFSLLTLIISILVAILVTFQITFVVSYKINRGDNSDVQELVSEMDDLAAVDYVYKNYYYGDIDKEKLERGLIEGYIYGTGDRYGEYMDAERYAEFTSDNNGENVGIGINVVENRDSSAIEIVNVVPDSPAEKAGLLVGDMIISVEGESVVDIGYSFALVKMQGEKGTKASFVVLRDSETIEFSVKRATITQLNVAGRMNDDGVTGIIRIEEFDTTTPKQFKSEIEKLIDDGAERFVFDVRNNPGGDLDSIVEILDYLLPKGPIIRIEDKDGNETTMDSDKEHLDMPMAVLTNGGTASAAELFASALQDYEAAALVGETTYGKGSMQTIVPLNDGAALRITYRMYKPPKSECYDGIGVKPDIKCELSEEAANKSIYKLTDEEDTQLMRAIEYLNTGK
ncbi:MAG: S41 family peptidase [Ruminococcaceae bacterium]|nr:S41 family peptidase [Oscillospiraceae bacterium]